MRNASEIEKASPVARRRAVIVFVVAALAGAWLVGSMNDWSAALQAWMTDDPASASDRARIAILALALLVCVPSVFAAVYSWRLGSSTIDAQRFPPPGSIPIRDTVVVHGDAAVRRGRLLRALAIASIAAGAIAVFLLVRLAVRLPGSAA